MALGPLPSRQEVVGFSQYASDSLIPMTSQEALVPLMSPEETLKDATSVLEALCLSQSSQRTLGPVAPSQRAPDLSLSSLETRSPLQST